MEQHSVSRSLHRGQTSRSSLGREHYLTVGVEKSQSHEGQINPVKHTVLIVDGRVAEEQRVVAEDGGVEEGKRLVDDGDEQVCEGGRGGEDEDDEDEEEGAWDGAHVDVVHREADGEVTLQRHAGQDERRGAGGEDRRHYLRGQSGGGSL